MSLKYIGTLRTLQSRQIKRERTYCLKTRTIPRFCILLALKTFYQQICIKCFVSNASITVFLSFTTLYIFLCTFNEDTQNFHRANTQHFLPSSMHQQHDSEHAILRFPCVTHCVCWNHSIHGLWSNLFAVVRKYSFPPTNLGMSLSF